MALLPPHEQCPVCLKHLATTTDAATPMNAVDCELCGHYRISRSARACTFTPEMQERRHLLSGLVRTVWEKTGKEYKVMTEETNAWETVLKNSPVPVPTDTDVPAKADAILWHLRRKSKFPGESVTLSKDTDYSVGFCRNETEFRFCLDYLVDRHFVKCIPRPSIPVACVSWDYRIAPAGWAYLEGVGAEAKDQGFVAMAFNPELTPVWTEGLFHGIENAGYKALAVTARNTTTALMTKSLPTFASRALWWPT